VVFVSKPTLEVMRAAVGEDKPLTAEDGIHPSEWGYAVGGGCTPVEFNPL
jgi:hypothetical protein